MKSPRWDIVFDHIANAPRTRKTKQDRYKLRRTSRRPKEHLLVAGWLIHVLQCTKEEFVMERHPITFSESFVDFVGGRMELGLTEATPAMIIVAQSVRKPHAHVLAAHTDLTWPTTLWREDTYPEWLRKNNE